MDGKHNIADPAASGQGLPKDYAISSAGFLMIAACLDYLDWLRWPSGFSCPKCFGGTAWLLKDGRWWRCIAADIEFLQRRALSFITQKRHLPYGSQRLGK